VAYPGLVNGGRMKDGVGKGQGQAPQARGSRRRRWGGRMWLPTRRVKFRSQMFDLQYILGAFSSSVSWFKCIYAQNPLHTFPRKRGSYLPRKRGSYRLVRPLRTCYGKTGVMDFGFNAAWSAYSLIVLCTWFVRYVHGKCWYTSMNSTVCIFRATPDWPNIVENRKARGAQPTPDLLLNPPLAKYARNSRNALTGYRSDS